MGSVPEITPDELAQRLDRGEALQVLDIRAPDKVARARIAFGQALDFRATPGSVMYRLPTLEPLELDSTRPVAVVCGHGNSSQPATTFLRERGLEAYSVAGGMAAWETVYVARGLTPTSHIQHVVQLDRLGKGALGYILVSDGDAVIVDPGRHLPRIEAVLGELRAAPVAVIDTHMHADYLSGARTAAGKWQVPYFVHPKDAVSPYDDTPGRITWQPARDGDAIAFGTAVLRVHHVPGHTLGSLALIADDALALTGDFIFVQSVGRPDLGGQAASWSKLLWASLERARRDWHGDLVILPAHYSAESERRADRAVAGRFDAIQATNPALAIRDERAFLEWVAASLTAPPEAYRTIKLANLGLMELTEQDAETLESGPNLCAVG
ncbi:MAG TPA: MBL fold metallo-hydrolase [Gemmatimonadales bacterium]|nr:MBL fold metallo-hydrolase [Gemmatimonadales bacterium]